MKKINNFVALFVLGLSLLYTGNTANAQNNNPFQGCEGPASGSPVCDDSDKSNPILDVIAEIVNIMSWALGIAVILMIMYGAFRYITSAGSPDAVASARKTIMYALIGLFLALSSRVLLGILS